MKADGRALDQADVFRSLPDRGFEAGEAGRAGLTPIRAPGDAPPPFGGFGEVASGMIFGLAILRRRARNSPSRAFAETARSPGSARG